MSDSALVFERANAVPVLDLLDVPRAIWAAFDSLGIPASLAGYNEVERVFFAYFGVPESERADMARLRLGGWHVVGAP